MKVNSLTHILPHAPQNRIVLLIGLLSGVALMALPFFLIRSFDAPPAVDPLVGEMVLVRGGTFTMDCAPEHINDCFKYEKQAHRGSWYHSEGAARVSDHDYTNPNSRGWPVGFLGFRLARNVNDKEQAKRDVSVPNIVGMTLVEAASEITEAGLVVGTTTGETHRTVAVGEVLSQSPVAGTAALRGTVVNMRVSYGPVIDVDEIVLVRGGTFKMGCASELDDCVDNEIPAQQVTLNDFYIGKYEVTQAQWREIMGTNVRWQRDYANRSWPPSGEGDNYPMYYVSWTEVQDFIIRLNEKTGMNYRLPTEAEWEYAARGGNQSRNYKYSGGNVIGDIAWYKGNSGKRTHYVGTKTANELGIYDMTGNVFEWVQDWFGNYSGNAQTNPQGPSSGLLRVFRGGSWNFLEWDARVSFRYFGKPSLRLAYLGFRLARSSNAEEQSNEYVSVPNVAGMTQAEAVSAITEAGLVVGTTIRENHNTIAAGEVISQSPAAGTSVMGRTTINLRISDPALDPLVGEMVRVRGGTFTMGCTPEQGSDCADDERQAHQVTLNDFYIGRYEVTQAQWQAVMGRDIRDISDFRRHNLPVESVSWTRVQEFIKRLNERTGGNYRLPTEAEWEYAARGGNQSRGYKYSGSNSIEDVAWYEGNSGKKTYPVGTKSANELGLHDMTGNVAELVQDWFGDYDSNAQTNPNGPSSGSSRVNRGGGWNANTITAQVSDRDNALPNIAKSSLGFRLARSSNAEARANREVFIPDVAGMTQAEAVFTITEAGLTLGTLLRENHGAVSEDIVTNQDPSAGTSATRGAAVNIRVSYGSVIDVDDMVLVRGGTFTMGCTPEQGSDCYYDERPAHQVTLSDFYIGKYEVTQAQWKAVMGNNYSSFRGDDNLPVVNVSWYDVQYFISKLNERAVGNYRLPTEAEWEYAARGGNQSRGYKYSGSNSIEDVAWYEDNSGKKIHPVRTKSANELGIHDMSGNVAEWVYDTYGSYSAGAQINPQGPSWSSARVHRGGSWHTDARRARSSVRSGFDIDAGSNFLGFRLARSF